MVIASFVTAYARLELFEVLQKLGKNVLYYDTDSVIYIENIHEEPPLQTGNYLGQLTDELAAKNCSEKWIEYFCTTGPKAYSYRTNEYTDEKGVKKRDEKVHVKGFSLKGDTAKKLHSTVLTRVLKIKKAGHFLTI